MIQLVVQYSYLQMLDLLTTIAFLLHGVQEANPLVRWILEHAPHPIGGLVAVKVVAVLLGLYCWRANRKRLLIAVNVFFAGVVAWNLVALIVASAGRGLA
jgi:hypothetical protein